MYDVTTEVLIFFLDDEHLIDIVAMASCVQLYGLNELVEILQRLSSCSNVSLHLSRPGKCRLFLQVHYAYPREHVRTYTCVVSMRHSH